MFGIFDDFGKIKYGIVVMFKDYLIKECDIFGNVIVVECFFVDVVDFEFEVEIVCVR